MNAKPRVITISRQYGSGGSYLGKMVAEKLAFGYFDRAILRQATEHLGADEAELFGREERISNFLENFSRFFIHGSPEAAYLPPPIRPVYDRDIFDAESKIIREIAEKHDAVIVGRCGFDILRGHPGLINVFIHAPVEFRMKRIMRTYSIPTEKEALSTLAEMDERRRRFVDSMAGVEWTDALNYHLSFDSSVTGFDMAERMILQLVDAASRREA